MTVSLAFFADAGLTVPLSRLDVIQAADDSLPAVDRVIYLASTAAGKRFNAASDPGVDVITLSVVNTASGIAATTVRLAASAGGLATATPGAPLELGTEILSGAVNSVPVHVRVDLPVTPIGRYENLSFELNELIETNAGGGA
jgi:hypothetical protein